MGEIGKDVVVEEQGGPYREGERRSTVLLVCLCVFERERMSVKE